MTPHEGDAELFHLARKMGRAYVPDEPMVIHVHEYGKHSEAYKNLISQDMAEHKRRKENGYYWGAEVK